VTWKKTAADRQRDSQRYGTAWRRARLACLQRAQWRCEVRLDGCTGRATEVDHVNGAAADPNHQHLRAACKSCHGKVTAQQGGGYRAKKAPADPEPRIDEWW
jgi:5-methylcytosine-specific restriction endonuclease McrA